MKISKKRFKNLVKEAIQGYQAKLSEQMGMMTLLPAYGRDYSSKREVRMDWDAGKDFKIASVGPHMGQYINKEDAEREGVGQVKIRYDNKRKVMILDV